MAFLAPVIVGALGLTGGAALIGEAIVGIGLAFGTAYLARKISPQSGSGSSPRGMQLSLSYDINGPRQIPFGLVASAGSLIYHNPYGPNGNDYVQMVFRWGDVPCTSLEQVYVNGKLVTLGSHVATSDVSGFPVNEFAGAMWIEPHLGDWTQTADADLVAKATGGTYSSNNRGRGVCYIRVTLKYDPTAYAQGFPKFLFVFKGAKLYDPRKDTTVGGSGSHRWGTESTYEWTDNAAVVLYNYLRGVYVNGTLVGGMNAPSTSLPVDNWSAAANACDETVALKGGGSENRYDVDAVVNVDAEFGSVVRDMLAAMAGSLVDSGGILKLYPGVSQTSVLTITDSDIIDTAPVTLSPKLSRSSLVNAVFGSFTHPSQVYQTAALPPRISSSDQTTDGGALLTQNYGLPYVTSGTQGQRVLEILRRRGRFQNDIAFTMRAGGAMLEAGDWITLTSSRYGFSNTTFEVVQASLNRDLTISIELREIAASIFSWTAASDQLDPVAPAGVGAGNSKLATVTGLAVSNVTLPAPGGLQIPGLALTWTAVTDTTVTGLLLEYRKVGDTTAIRKTIFDPSAASYTVTEAIQGGVQYEARLDLITAPVRGTVATSWVASGETTSSQIVGTAAVSLSSAPGSVTMASLDAQTAYELQLVTALKTVQGADADRFQTVIDDLQTLSASLLQNYVLALGTDAAVKIETARRQTLSESFASYTVSTDAALAAVNSNLSGQASTLSALSSQVTTQGNSITTNSTAITSLQNAVSDPSTGNVALANAASLLTTRVTTAEGNITSQASSLSSLSSTVGSHTTSITTLNTSVTTIQGWHAAWAVSLDVNGYVQGYVGIDGTNGTTTFGVLANKLVIAQPGVTGGSPVTVFTIGNINGTPGIGIGANVIIDGSVKVRHLDATDIATLYITGPDGLYYFDFANGKIGSTDGLVTFDIRNKTLDMSADFLLDFRFNYDSMYVPSVLGVS